MNSWPDEFVVTDRRLIKSFGRREPFERSDHATVPVVNADEFGGEAEHPVHRVVGNSRQKPPMEMLQFNIHHQLPADQIVTAKFQRVSQEGLAQLLDIGDVRRAQGRAFAIPEDGRNSQPLPA